MPNKVNFDSKTSVTSYTVDRICPRGHYYIRLSGIRKRKTKKERHKETKLKKPKIYAKLYKSSWNWYICWESAASTFTFLERNISTESKKGKSLRDKTQETKNFRDKSAFRDKTKTLTQKYQFFGKKSSSLCVQSTYKLKKTHSRSEIFLLKSPMCLSITLSFTTLLSRSATSTYSELSVSVTID